MTRKPVRKPSGPILDPVPGLRQRQRADGSWRLWWEPNAAQRAAGAVVVEMDAGKPGHGAQQAKTLHAQWTAAVRGEAPVVVASGRSMNALIEDYLASRHFTRKPDTTQRSYRSDLKAIGEKWGPQPVTSFDAPIMDQWYDSLLVAKGPWRAKAILTMARILFKHGERRGWREKGSNPCTEMEYEATPLRNRVGSWAELDACLQAARRLGLRQIRCALLLAVYGGQRQGDQRLARPEQFQVFSLNVPGMDRPRRVWVWSLTRSKRGNEGIVAIHAAAVPALRVQLRRCAAGEGPGTLLWDEATGKTFTPEQFFKRWEAVRAEAARHVPSVATLTWRDIRRTFGHLARGGGASKGDVADVLGNTADTNAQLAAIYMAPQIATSLRAVDAIQRPAPVVELKPLKRKEG